VASPPGLAITGLLARRAARSGLIWGVVFGATAASSITQFTAAYDTPQSRHEIAVTIGGNGALRALFGSGRDPRDGGRVDGLAQSGDRHDRRFDLGPAGRHPLAAGRGGLRTLGAPGGGADDPSGRGAQAVGALAVGLGALWAATAAVVLAAGRVPEAHFAVTASLFLALTLVGPATVFLAVGALASQVAPTRRQASQLAAAVFGAAFLLRVVGNSGPRLHWVQWTTPLGWVQHLHPLTGPSVLPLLPLAALITGLATATVALADRRDVGAGVLPAATPRPPTVGLLGGPLRFAVRLQRTTWLSWAAGLAVMSFLFGSWLRRWPRRRRRRWRGRWPGSARATPAWRPTSASST